eukprot:m.179636 g.179636  ORF g.179636 m.179636 type:complete len:58 (-) comp31983_c4_seq1:253-426(-)
MSTHICAIRVRYWEHQTTPSNAQAANDQMIIRDVCVAQPVLLFHSPVGGLKGRLTFS